MARDRTMHSVFHLSLKDKKENILQGVIKKKIR